MTETVKSLKFTCSEFFASCIVMHKGVFGHPYLDSMIHFFVPAFDLLTYFNSILALPVFSSVLSLQIELNIEL